MNEVEISVMKRNDDQVSPERPIGTEAFTATPLQQKRGWFRRV